MTQEALWMAANGSSCLCHHVTGDYMLMIKIMPIFSSMWASQYNFQNALNNHRRSTLKSYQIIRWFVTSLCKDCYIYFCLTTHLTCIALAGADASTAAAVCGESSHPQHLPHGGGHHQLQLAPQHRHTHILQSQHPLGLHRLQGQPDGWDPCNSSHHSPHWSEKIKLFCLSAHQCILFAYWIWIWICFHSAHLKWF